MWRPQVHRFVISVMEAAFAMSAGVTCARSRFPDPVEGEWREGRGRLTVRRGWRFLHLEGTPRDLGMQHGRLLGPLVRDTLREYLNAMAFWRGLGRKELLRRGRLLESYIPDRYREEMAALAEGAEVPYEDILVAHTFLESVQAVACSCYAAYGGATNDGGVVFGRNLDFLSMGFAHRCGVVAFVKPDGGIPFVSASWAGWCGTLTAVNLSGLCLGLMNVPKLSRHTPGMPYAIMFRRMAQETATCAEAVEMLRATPRTFSNNIMLAQTTPVRRAVVAEYDVGGVAVREPAAGEEFIVSTNHFRKLGREQERTDGSGPGRYATLRREVAARRGRLDHRMRLFADPAVHLPNSLHSMIVAPERREFLLSMGRMPAGAGPYRAFSYGEEGIVERIVQNAD